MLEIISENKRWIDETWDKLDTKLKKTALLSRNKLPYTTINGVHDDTREEGRNGVAWWTNGFWPGLMWLMYVGTKDNTYKETAEYAEKLLDEAMYDFEKLHHDVGFMWHISAGVNYRLSSNAVSKNRNLHAAAILASRYNPDGEFIRAWNSKESLGWVIIDSMMNIPLLYWASRETGDARFEKIAMHHADKVMNNHIRPDGSVYHVLEFDSNNGELLSAPWTQGFEPEKSSWSRGQAWAIYGFVLSYIHTGQSRYLDAAKRVAHYFIAAVCNDGFIPKSDFRCPDEPVVIDTTAGACAACGLIEIAKAVPEFEQKMYIKTAINILKAIEKEHCNWSDEEQSIVQNGSECYDRGVHMPIIYGDYYFAEAIYKLKGNDVLFW